MQSKSLRNNFAENTQYSIYMKATGIVRRVDVLGRVVIPREIRRILKIEEGDPLEIFTDRDEIILKKYSPIFNADGLADCVAASLSARTGHTAAVCDKDVFLSACGTGSKDFRAKNISKKLFKLLDGNKPLVVNHADGGEPADLTDGENYGFFNELVMPIATNKEVIGGIILADKSKDMPITSVDIQLAALSADFIAAHF